uniref:Protein kinase domain-containing protein n=1 Tax=Loa loa TaxID=7209 RepID=A0A1I7VWW8_LOALO
MRSREKKKRNGSSEDASSTKETPEDRQQLQQQPVVHPPPLEPFQVTYVEKSGASVGRVFVGDVIVAVDGYKISAINELNSVLKKPSLMVAVVFKRTCYSKCKHKRTFVEKISVERGREMKCTGQAIDQYLARKLIFRNQKEILNKLNQFSRVQMALRINDMIDVSEVLGLSVKYDAKERIQVNATAVDSLSSLHLRPGDIIREVNEYPIASKTMLNHFIQAAIIEKGQVNFTIESSAGGIDSYRDQVELANDVLEITQKQIIQFRMAVASKTLNRPSILRKEQTSKSSRKTVISQDFVELPIGADFDPSKLKTCKSANIEMRSMQKREGLEAWKLFGDEMMERTVRALRVQGPGHGREVEITFGEEHLHASGVFANVYSARLYRPVEMIVAIKKTWPDMGKLRMSKIGRRFPLLDAKLYAFQMFSAIDYVNALGIAHRDVKPSNLIVDDEKGILKLADFGSAKLLRESEENTPYQVTRYYRAPELIFGSTRYSTAVDVWACGCVLSEFVTGKVLLQGSTWQDQARLVIDIFGYPSTEQCQAMKVKKPRYARKRARSLRVILNACGAPNDMIQLLQAILVYEPHLRLKGNDVLRHSFFNDLRKIPLPVRSNGRVIPHLDYTIYQQSTQKTNSDETDTDSSDEKENESLK